jgi:hypothetical protein
MATDIVAHTTDTAITRAIGTQAIIPTVATIDMRTIRSRGQIEKWPNQPSGQIQRGRRKAVFLVFVTVRYWPIADIRWCTANVRFRV